MKRPHVGSRTFSDAGPWRQYQAAYGSGDTDVHIVPGFERRRHVLHPLCHCHPVVEIDELGEWYHHNVAQ